MKTIYKYQLARVDRQTLQMPKSACLLTVQIQRDDPCVWALIDTANELTPVTFITVGTGQPDLHLECYAYIGTYQYRLFVFHVFASAT